MPRKTIARPLPSVEYLHECFHYNPETGVLTWRERPREHFSSALASRSFTTRWAGKHAGSPSRNGYLRICIAYDFYYCHRIAWAMHHGQWPTHHIDHINGIRTDNRISNLRDVTKPVNSRNMVMRNSNTSGHCGVHWDEVRRKWVAQIRVNYKNYNLGGYTDIADAISARQQANVRFDFSPRHGQDMVQLPDN